MDNNTKFVTVAIIDEDVNYRESLKQVFLYEKKIEIYNVCSNSDELIKEIKNNSTFPDVCIKGIDSRKQNYIDFIRKMKKINPKMHFIITTNNLDIKTYTDLVKIGCDYIEKGKNIDILIEKINKLSSKRTTKSPNQKSKNELKKYIELKNLVEASEKNVKKLTDIQLQVVRLKNQKKSQNEIAEILDISPGTVHTHYTRAMKKINLPDLLNFILD